jgi:hypothetical protein
LELLCCSSSDGGVLMLRRDSRVPTCPVALLFEGVFDEIVKKLKADTPAAAYPPLIESVTTLKEHLAPKAASSLHFGSIATGTGHWCLEESFAIAVTYLETLQALAPLPPAPAPPRRQPPRSPDAVVNDVSSLADEVKRPGDTFLGEER